MRRPNPDYDGNPGKISPTYRVHFTLADSSIWVEVIPPWLPWLLVAKRISNLRLRSRQEGARLLPDAEGSTVKCTPLILL